MLTEIQTKKYVTNPNLIVIQSKLFSPSYSGPGKWIVYNPDNKKGYLAVGKDRLPDLIPLLTNASHKAIDSTELNDSRINKLVNNGLLIEESRANNLLSDDRMSFVQKYQKAVYNFPFRDYYEKDWYKKDIATMEHYNKLWDHPPAITKRSGTKEKLNEIDPDELNISNKEISLNFITLLLQTVFCPIEEIGGYPKHNLRKISPSGGGKHPIEALVILRKSFGNISKGIYTYDVESNSLIENKNYDTEAIDIKENDCITIVLRARVERPMWRYREIRSFRAIMLDAGHVLENIRQISEYKGMYTSTSSAEKETNLHNFEWVREPSLCSIHISPFKMEQENTIKHNPLSKLPKTNKYLTNPSMYFSFRKGRLICNTLWPNTQSLDVSFKDFEVLTHCLPSRRGDRDISDKGLMKEFFIEKSKIMLLNKNNALVPENIAKKLYQEVSLWSNHNWYLNFLVYCEVHHSNEVYSESFRNDVILKTPNKLFQRKTSRKFNTKEIPYTKFQRILQSAIPKLDKETELIVNVKNVEGTKKGLYKWKNNQLNLIGDCLSEQCVRDLVIGQAWAGSGALDIWIKREIKPQEPSSYEMDIIKLGVVGQRICITATEEDIATFMTPAVEDKISFKPLQLEDDYKTILYHFTIGVGVE